MACFHTNVRLLRSGCTVLVRPANENGELFAIVADVNSTMTSLRPAFEHFESTVSAREKSVCVYTRAPKAVGVGHQHNTPRFKVDLILVVSLVRVRF